MAERRTETQIRYGTWGLRFKGGFKVLVHKYILLIGFFDHFHLAFWVRVSSLPPRFGISGNSFIGCEKSANAYVCTSICVRREICTRLVQLESFLSVICMSLYTYVDTYPMVDPLCCSVSPVGRPLCFVSPVRGEKERANDGVYTVLYWTRLMRTPLAPHGRTRPSGFVRVHMHAPRL